MNYSKSVLLYQDEPTYGLLLKLVISIVPIASLVGSVYLFSSGDTTDAIVLLVEAFIVGLIFWSVLPRRYQIYEDHLRIVLGGPFSVKVGFTDIKSIGVTSGFTLSINLITKLTKKFVVIAKKRGLSVAITPEDSNLFIENANEALNQWMKLRPNNS